MLGVDLWTWRQRPWRTGDQGANRRQIIQDGLALLTWQQDTFAYADSYDETARRYKGLRGGVRLTGAGVDTPGLLVPPEVARTQLGGRRPQRMHPGLTQRGRQLLNRQRDRKALLRHAGPHAFTAPCVSTRSAWVETQVASPRKSSLT
jgi:hypothetical protein